MTQFIQGSPYDHLKKEYLRYPISQVVDKLIEEMQINELKSKSILKMESRIDQLESFNKNKGISLTQGKESQLQKLREAHEERLTKRESGLSKTPRRQKSQFGYRQLNTTRTPERQEIFHSPSPRRNERNDELRISLQQSTKTITQLSLKNTSLISQLNLLREQVITLSNTNDQLIGEIKQIQINQQLIIKQNNQLSLDCQYKVDECQKSVAIIQKLLLQLEQFKLLHTEKSSIIQSLTANINELQLKIARLNGQIQSHQNSSSVYQNKIKDLLETEGEYDEEISRLNQIQKQNQLVIDRLGRQNAHIRKQFEEEINNSSILSQVISEMRERNHNLQKKVLLFEGNSEVFNLSLEEKQRQIDLLVKQIGVLETNIERSLEEKESLKKQFFQISENFKDQINNQLKLIGEYEKVQKVKQLSNLKEKFKGEDKPKQFKLTTFNQRLNFGKSNCLVSVEEDQNQQIKQKVQVREDETMKLKTSSQGLKGLVISIEKKMNQLIGTYDMLNQKTNQLTRGKQDNSY